MSWNRTAALCLVLAGLAVTGCNDSSTVAGPDTAPPLAPQDVNAYVKVDGKVVVRWSPNVEPDLAGYNVYQMSPYGRVNNNLIAGSESSCVLNLDGTASYRVTAVDFSGNESAPSKVARASSARTPSIDPVSGENQHK